MNEKEREKKERRRKKKQIRKKTMQKIKIYFIIHFGVLL